RPTFLGVTVDKLVLGGQDAHLPKDKESGRSTNTVLSVYRNMLWQICRDYPGLPDPRTLTTGEIRFFYDGLRPELKKHASKPAASQSPRATRVSRPVKRRKSWQASTRSKRSSRRKIAYRAR